jgi:hypothetical protein
LDNRHVFPTVDRAYTLDLSSQYRFTLSSIQAAAANHPIGPGQPYLDFKINPNAGESQVSIFSPFSDIEGGISVWFLAVAVVSHIYLLLLDLFISFFIDLSSWQSQTGPSNKTFMVNEMELWELLGQQALLLLQRAPRRFLV